MIPKAPFFISPAYFAVLEVGHSLRSETVEGIDGEGLVVVAPPDVLGDFGRLDDELVLRAAAGALAGEHSEGTALEELAFAAADGMFVEDRDREVVVDGGGVGQDQACCIARSL
jgi:hypothetical protein